jgi:hypothetical protein
MHPNDYLTWDKGRRERTLMAASRLFAVLATLFIRCQADLGTARTPARLSRFSGPGHLIDIGGRQIQIDCREAGSPTVAFESGSTSSAR